tara:strand:+ start:543 stop:797 length:255 start_codon:yes stop_codon:yes gene_type:complete
MSPKIIHTTDHQSHCYNSDPDAFDQLTIDLWDDGDVRIANEEADIIIKLEDLVDIAKELIDRLMIHHHEVKATIRKKMEVLDAE